MRMRIDMILDVAPGVSLSRREVYLLEYIRKTGSLSKAADKLRVGYKTAWGIISRLNKTGKDHFTQACAGGLAGGKTTLTPYGLRIIAKYKKRLEKLRQLARREEYLDPF